VATASSKPRPPTAAAQVRTYLAALPPAPRKALKQLAATIRATAPGAEDAFSYRIPAFRLGGRPLVWYAGWKEHVSLYPVTPAMRRAGASTLARYQTSTGTVRFPLTHPLPLAFVRKLVRARVAEILRGTP
jgi:uncharacterized protein YdhG (YjbR/CyaY superfamily)